MKELIQKLKTCSAEERRDVAMELARTKDEDVIFELKRMVAGERKGIISKYNLNDQLIAIEALAETENIAVYTYLRDILATISSDTGIEYINAKGELKKLLQQTHQNASSPDSVHSRVRISIEKLEESVTRFNEVERLFMPYVYNDYQRIKEDYVLPTIADLMKLRLEGKIPWTATYYSVSGIVWVGDEKPRFKIIRRCEELLDKTRHPPQTYNTREEWLVDRGSAIKIPVVNQYDLNGIDITKEEYDAISAVEFARGELSVPYHTEAEIVKHRGWLELVGDQELLGNYTQEVFKRLYDDCGKKIAMAFNPGDFVKGCFMLGPWSLENLRYGKSSAHGEFLIYGHWNPYKPKIIEIRSDLL